MVGGMVEVVGVVMESGFSDGKVHLVGVRW